MHPINFDGTENEMKQLSESSERVTGYIGTSLQGMDDGHALEIVFEENSRGCFKGSDGKIYIRRAVAVKTDKKR